MNHPRAGPWQKPQPGRLNTQEQIRRAHAGGDGNEHCQYNYGRLRKCEAERGPEKRRSAWRGQHGCEYALENEPKSSLRSVVESKPRENLCGSEISNTPNRFKANTSTITLSARTK